MKKQWSVMALNAVIILALPAVAAAHVVVTPAQAGVGDRVLFSVSVPNERQTAVESIKLDVPKGVEDVQPDVAAGWGITTTADSDGNVTSVTWTGAIPVGRRADLLFRAQTPAAAGQLDWKAYQTYADGTTVHWDQTPATGSSRDSDDATAGPYSVTKVADDLDSGTSAASGGSTAKATLALAFSIAALALSVGGLLLRRPR